MLGVIRSRIVEAGKGFRYILLSETIVNGKTSSLKIPECIANDVPLPVTVVLCSGEQH